MSATDGWSLVFPLIIVVVVLTCIPFARGYLNCTVSAGSSCSTGSVKLLGVENSTGGYNNSHAQNLSLSTYANSLCCNATTVLVSAFNTSCGGGATTWLRLAGTDNAHVQQANESDYNTSMCLSAVSASVSISYADDTCSSGYGCMISIANANGGSYGNSTNAHIGDCSAYTRKVCGSVALLPVCINETGTCYSTIQAAVTAATNNQTVVITDNATYIETVSITRNITITSNGSSYPNLTGGWNSELFSSTGSNLVILSRLNVYVTGSGVTRGFNIKNGTFTYGSIFNNASSANGIAVLIPTSGFVYFDGINFTSFNGGPLVEADLGIATVNNSNMSTGNGANLLTGRINIYNTKIYDIGFTQPIIVSHSGTALLSNVTINATREPITISSNVTVVDSIFHVRNASVIGYILRFFTGSNISVQNTQLIATNAPGLFFSRSVGNVTITNVSVSSVRLALVNGSTGSRNMNVTIINSTPTIATTQFVMDSDDAANFTYQKYLDVLVQDGGASPVSGATVLVRDLYGLLVVNESTSGSGVIPQQTLTYERINWSGASNTTTYYDNHSVGAVKAFVGSANTSVNMSLSRSLTLTLLNTAPSVPVLLLPTDNNSTLLSRYPTFNWTDSTDAEGDTITYQWNLSSPVGCAAIPLKNASVPYYASVDKLCVDSTYNWTVRACDNNSACSSYSSQFNFTIPSTVGIAFTSAAVSFGSLIPSDPSINRTNDTLTNTPAPLVYNNTGNVDVAVTAKADAVLWSSQLLNTSYFQYADENSSAWMNMTSSYTALTANVTTGLVRELELSIWVPQGESAGAKSTTVTVLGASNE